jgi:signal transduction histidine kinase
MHPRVFAALGADLVTNDVVALIELVKNSYDAFANKVWIRFKRHQAYGDLLEIEDDGQGMTKDVIENVWSVVATPFKETNPYIKSGKKTRRVAGEKGLGRLSVARLGNRLHMLTQAPDSECLEVEVNWSDVYSGDDISSSFVKCRKYSEKSPFKDSGTLLQIYGLRGLWDESRILDLEQNLARLISPFSDLGEFSIFISRPGKLGPEEAKIESPEFLTKPKYAITGTVDEKGKIKCTYRFAPIREDITRERELKLNWEQVYDNIQERTNFPFKNNEIHCGPFSFEIRAWDIGTDDTKEIAEKFDFQKSQIRKAIRAHKGISIYRDGVLVLPKTDNARDWLGLDLRRISKVGTRLSTSQIVGYVSISAEKNPEIDDTSDRERLASNLEVAEFEELLKSIVSLLENERDIDRIKPEREKPLEDLFSDISAESMIAEVAALAEEGADASEALPILRTYSSYLDSSRKKIQERFVHYSRLATVGTIAQMLVHEIRNRTSAFGSFLEFIKSRFGPFKDKEIEEEYQCADTAVDALERLADTFSPLASRAFRRRKRHSILEERIRECLSLQGGEIKRKGIKCHVPKSETHVAVDPGELDAILLNLINNAVYWLSQTSEEKRDIEFRLQPMKEGNRVRVWINDTGPGIHEDDVEKVFWPGVTRKPGGIGMGLTVASELVGEYGGNMSAKHPGIKGGASFAFDLPLKN